MVHVHFFFLLLIMVILHSMCTPPLRMHAVMWYEWEHHTLVYWTTVEPPNKRHVVYNIYKFSCCVLCREAVLFLRFKMYWETNFGTLTCVLYLWRGLLYCVPISEGPLSEVPLYCVHSLVPRPHPFNFTIRLHVYRRQS